MADQKSFLLHFDRSEHDQLARAASSAGVSMQAYARDAILDAAQEDQAVLLAAQALQDFGPSFGLDPGGNGRKIAELRSRSRSVA